MQDKPWQLCKMDQEEAYFMKTKIVCIGNSITNGFPFKRSQSFPSLIREATGFEVINKGENGESTGQVLDRFQEDVIAHKPDLVTILTGTNDFIFSLDTTKGSFEKIEEMVRLAKAANIKILLMTPLLTLPEMAKEAWMSGAEIDYYQVNEQLRELGLLIKEYVESQGNLKNENAINSEYIEESTGTEGVIKRQDITLLDLQELYQEFERCVGRENVFHDGLHPTIEGQAFIADCILKCF